MPNPLITPQGASQAGVGPPGLPMQPSAPQGPMAGPGSSMVSSGGIPTPQTMPTPEQLSKSRDHIGIIMQEMTDLIGRSQLSRKDVMDAAGRMIQKGAFPEADGKKQLVAQLAGLPENEQAIRQFLGQHLLDFAGAAHTVDRMLAGNAPQAAPSGQPMPDVGVV